MTNLTKLTNRTSPTPSPNQPHFVASIDANFARRATVRFALASTICILVSVGLAACGEGEEAAPAPVARYEPPPPPPPPPEVSVKSIDELMKELGIDSRVSLPEHLAPDTTEKRIAVLKFWDAFAKGDDIYLSARMSDLDRKVLAAMTKGQEWKATTASITSIDVQCKDEDGGFATFGLVTSGAVEQAMLWDAVQTGDEASFTAFPGTQDIIAHLSGADSIESWKTYINGLFDKYANMPDEVVEIPQSDVQLAEGSPAEGDGSGDTPSAPPPGGGSGGGVLRKKPHAPIPD